MTQAERAPSTTTRRRSRRRPRLAAVRRRLDADAQHAAGWADMIDGFQTHGAGDAPADPDDLRRRLRARARQPDRRDAASRTTSASAPRATRGSSQRRRAHGGRRGDPRHRRPVGVRAVPVRRPRRPLGSHLRELRGGPGAGEDDGDLDRRAPGQRPSDLARNDRVLATAKHFAGDGDTTYGSGASRRQAATTRSTRASPSEPPARRAHRPRAVRAGGQAAPRRLGHAVVLQHRLHRRRPRQPGQDARQPGADQGLAEGQAGLRRVRHQRLPRHRPDPAGHLRADRSRPGSTPASTWSWSRTTTQAFEDAPCVSEVQAGRVTHARGSTTRCHAS